MIRTILSLVLLCTAIFASGAASSQSAQLGEARAELQAGRDLIIREDLQLSDVELAAFWPVYEEYVAALAPLRDRKAVLVTRFLDAYEAGRFSDDFAAWLIEENFAIREGWMRVQQEFVPKFLEVLPVQAVARFLQLENKLDAEVDAQLAIAVPLVE